MEVRIVQRRGILYIETIADGSILRETQDALDLMAICGEYDTNLLMLSSEILPDDFFHLSSGLAGDILQKFSNYRMKVVAVADDSRFVGKFGEFAVETNRGDLFRIYSDRYQAENWLIAD